MKITPIKGTGLEISLDGLLRLRISVGGTDFWYMPNQEIMLDRFSPFLPNMKYDAERNVVVVSMEVDGIEVMGTSRPMLAPNYPLNPAIYNELKERIAELKSLASSHGLNADSKLLFQEFAIPNPKEEPEMYRLYGSKHSPKLAIIWGIEKIPESSLTVSKLDIEQYFNHGAERNSRGRIITVTIALLLLAAAGIGILKYTNSASLMTDNDAAEVEAIDGIVDQKDVTSIKDDSETVIQDSDESHNVEIAREQGNAMLFIIDEQQKQLDMQYKQAKEELERLKKSSSVTPRELAASQSAVEFYDEKNLFLSQVDEYIKSFEDDSSLNKPITQEQSQRLSEMQESYRKMLAAAINYTSHNKDLLEEKISTASAEQLPQLKRELEQADFENKIAEMKQAEHNENFILWTLTQEMKLLHESKDLAPSEENQKKINALILRINELKKQLVESRIHSAEATIAAAEIELRLAEDQINATNGDSDAKAELVLRSQLTESRKEDAIAKRDHNIKLLEDLQNSVDRLITIEQNIEETNHMIVESPTSTLPASIQPGCEIDYFVNYTLNDSRNIEAFNAVISPNKKLADICDDVIVDEYDTTSILDDSEIATLEAAQKYHELVIENHENDDLPKDEIAREQGNVMRTIIDAQKKQLKMQYEKAIGELERLKKSLSVTPNELAASQSAVEFCDQKNQFLYQVDEYIHSLEGENSLNRTITQAQSLRLGEMQESYRKLLDVTIKYASRKKELLEEKIETANAAQLTRLKRELEQADLEIKIAEMKQAEHNENLLLWTLTQEMKSLHESQNLAPSEENQKKINALILRVNELKKQLIEARIHSAEVTIVAAEMELQLAEDQINATNDDSDERAELVLRSQVMESRIERATEKRDRNIKLLEDLQNSVDRSIIIEENIEDTNQVIVDSSTTTLPSHIRPGGEVYHFVNDSLTRHIKNLIRTIDPNVITKRSVVDLDASTGTDIGTALKSETNQELFEIIHAYIAENLKLQASIDSRIDNDPKVLAAKERYNNAQQHLKTIEHQGTQHQRSEAEISVREAKVEWLKERIDAFERLKLIIKRRVSDFEAVVRKLSELDLPENDKKLRNEMSKTFQKSISSIIKGIDDFSETDITIFETLKNPILVLNVGKFSVTAVTKARNVDGSLLVEFTIKSDDPSVVIEHAKIADVPANTEGKVILNLNENKQEISLWVKQKGKETPYSMPLELNFYK